MGTRKKRKEAVDLKAKPIGTHSAKTIRDTMPRRKAAALVVGNVRNYLTLDNMPRLLARMADGEEILLGAIIGYTIHDDQRWGRVTLTVGIPGVAVKGADL